MKYGLLLVLSAVTSMALGFWQESTAIASAGFARNLRNDIFRTTQTFSFGNIDKFSTSSLITRLTTDVSNVQHAFQMTTRIGARSPVMLVFALYFSFRTSVRLSLVFLGTTVILGLGLYLSIRHVYPVFVRVFKRYDKMNRIVQENLFAIRVVKNYTRESHEKRNFAAVSKLIYEDFTTAGIRIARISPLMNFCVFLSTTLIAWFGANEIVASGNNPALGLTTGQLTSLVTYTMQILVSLMMLSNIFIFFLVSRASVERIVEVLDETSDLHNGHDPVYEVPDGSIISKTSNLLIRPKRKSRFSAISIFPYHLGESRHSWWYRLIEIDAHIAHSASLRCGRGSRLSGALMCVTMIWLLCATKFPLFFREINSSRGR